VTSIAARLAALDWAAVEAALWTEGHAVIPALLEPAECVEIARAYGEEHRFRSRIDMARYRLGSGEYKYFGHPLPDAVSELRAAAYRHLAPTARRWARALGAPERYPDDLVAFLARCARHGQRRPTPLLLRYEAGGYNCLHQDIYGPVAFPLQLACMLSRPGVDYTGGEFLLVEQRPRAQSRGEAVTLPQGAAVVFATRFRPVRGARGHSRAAVRHGVSRVRSGERMTLGVIFHDAE
jgi:hypothetical protein